MLTDTKLRNLKPDKLYKVNDREGLYVGVASENGIYGHSVSTPILNDKVGLLESYPAEWDFMALLQIVGGDKLIIPFADGAAHEPIQRPAFSA